MRLKKLIGSISSIGLFGTVTNFIFISPLPTLFSPIFIILGFRNKDKVPKFYFYLLLFFIYVILSALLYDPKALITFQFYRYDGNLIISFLPLLYFPLYKLNVNINALFRKFLIFSTLLNFFLYVYFIFKIGGNLSPINSYGSLFIAKNAAGGFLSIMGSLAYIYMIRKFSLLNVLLFVLNFLFVFSTFSRGSLLGLIVGIVFYHLFKLNWSKLIRLCVSIIIIVQGIILYFSFPIYKYYLRDVDPTENTRSFVQKNFQGDYGGKTVNIFIRTFDTWPRGWDTFKHSPIFGMGFGSINDVPFKFEDIIPCVFVLNKQDRIYGDAHAHHSYLHFLGEFGLVGLVIFLLFWFNIFYFLKNNNTNLLIRDFLIIVFYNLSIMSFTEHRITTPSNALPFILFIGLYISYCNFVKNK